jgi:hypothetical protein
MRGGGVKDGRDRRMSRKEMTVRVVRLRWRGKEEGQMLTKFPLYIASSDCYPVEGDQGSRCGDT